MMHRHHVWTEGVHSKGINAVDIKQNRSVSTELAAFLHLECTPIVRRTTLRFLAAHDEDAQFSMYHSSFQALPSRHRIGRL